MLMEPETPPTAAPGPATPGGTSGARLILAAGVSIIGIILALTYAYTRFWHAPEEASVKFGRAVAGGIRDFFHFTPEVTVNQTIVIETPQPIFELATVSQELQVDYKLENSQFLSEKFLQLRGQFLAKAGFDIARNCRLRIDGRTKHVVAFFPEPVVLSLEMKDYSIERSQSGWWNRLSQEDQKKALDQMRGIARSRAHGMFPQAKANLEAKIKEIVAGQGGTVEFRYERGKLLPEPAPETR